MTDLDALIAELRGFAAGSVSARAELMRDAADALESTAARLREAEAVIESVRREAKEWLNAPADQNTPCREVGALFDHLSAYQATKTEGTDQ